MSKTLEQRAEQAIDDFISETRTNLDAYPSLKRDLQGQIMKALSESYRKALEDAAQTVEGMDTPSPELQDVIAAAIREMLD